MGFERTRSKTQDLHPMHVGIVGHVVSFVLWFGVHVEWSHVCFSVRSIDSIEFKLRRKNMLVDLIKPCIQASAAALKQCSKAHAWTNTQVVWHLHTVAVDYNTHGAEICPPCRMMSWLDATILESHFAEMKSMGVEVIRVPCGYWNWVTYAHDDGPEVSGVYATGPIREAWWSIDLQTLQTMCKGCHNVTVDTMLPCSNLLHCELRFGVNHVNHVNPESQDVPKCPKMSQDVPRCPKMSQDVPRKAWKTFIESPHRGNIGNTLTESSNLQSGISYADLSLGGTRGPIQSEERVFPKCVWGPTLNSQILAVFRHEQLNLFISLREFWCFLQGSDVSVSGVFPKSFFWPGTLLTCFLMVWHNENLFGLAVEAQQKQVQSNWLCSSFVCCVL